jgi:chromate reductase
MVDPKISVAVLIGSPRKESLSRRVASGLKAVAPPELELKVVEIGHLPLFNPDLDRETPASWIEFRGAIKAARALLFVTPEYNRSVPAILKNALEIGSRPYQSPAWTGKPAAIVSQSNGMLGGFGANHHLRQILVFLDVHVLAQPEIYLSQADRLFTAEGALAEGPGRELLQRFMNQFSEFILRHPAAEI